MARLTFPFENARVHLAVEGSTGGTTLGLHMAADAIKHGGRVLWASPEMPDGVRFGQLFEHLSLADSSKFHAMNLVGSLSQAVDVLVQTSTALPSVRLIVLDDWCAQSGRIPSDRIQDAQHLAERLSDDIGLVLISKAGINAGGEGSSLNVRGHDKMKSAGFEIWSLERPTDGPRRSITINGDVKPCRIEDEGFVDV
ncbi:MAG TPA: hypothetical protein D7H93_01160 [Candidatus Poseidoniales archaeon]|jgi:hypothetical protein|nr:hypothetical protein [Candidatus Poseidoniaceae archaeon]MDP6362957.1 hypothetical protein [Candidatus Poseidoniaceae archaeon]DAC47224.1 MAG TPA: hypothetical protein D7H93_01160 [Candidatus Poseidoniales archaeon]HII21312.1 hypothetical protein [Candidatus Poseidoniaceae archaeon]|tara:strand:- start:442 stop:1032 length:591 start_codon:yes stop_codon:yes gene_type:complete